MTGPQILGLAAAAARPRILDTAAVAALAGVVPKSVDRYRERGQMPKPDGWVSGRPWWYETTIREWLANRPGRGAGGGRPRKETT